MVKQRLYVLFYLMALGCTVFAQPANDSIFNPGALHNMMLVSVQENKTVSLKKIISSAPLYLFVFLSPECPLSQNYTGVLNKMSGEYTGQVKFAGIFPGKSYSVKTIRKFVSDYSIAYPALIDNDKKLTRFLHGSVTPEVVLLNERFELVYKGAIDNLVRDLGEKKIRASEFYLKDAIERTLLKQDISVKRTVAIGCLINDY